MGDAKMVRGCRMSYMFKPGVREQVGLLVGLIGPSGSGKSFSAMRIASGIVGKGNRFAVIDTESRRALHYASQFEFDYVEMSAPFRSLQFAEAIKAAELAGYKAIVVDSCSAEWAGEGGVLDFQEEELTRMAGDSYQKREACKMAAWIKPKMQHKQMVQRLLQTKAHLILCFRAEEKSKIIDKDKSPDGKTHIVSLGFQPICSKEMPYELTTSFLLSSDKPGIGQPIKLQEQHKVIFPAGKLLDESAGKAIAEWAAGGVAKQPVPSPEKPADESKLVSATPDQIAELKAKMAAVGMTDEDAQKAFWLFVLPKGTGTKERANDWIENFETKLREWKATINHL